jgi:hypothetical protein
MIFRELVQLEMVNFVVFDNGVLMMYMNNYFNKIETATSAMT